MYVQLILELLTIIFIDILINLDILVVRKMLLLNSNVVLVVNLGNFLKRKISFVRSFYFVLIDVIMELEMFFVGSGSLY